MFRRLALRSLTAAMFTVSAGVLAHTTVVNEATEDASSHNALQTGHGCELEDGTNIPMIAQSVVFPTVNPTVTRSKDGAAVDLATVIDQGDLAGLVDPVQSRDIFAAQDEKTDANGNVIGFHSTNGNLQTNLRGYVPFRFSSVNFSATSCARSLQVQIAVADICAMEFPPTHESANLWIPAGTTLFPADLHGVGSPATLTINRTTKVPRRDANGESCVWTDADGVRQIGWDVTVTPSNEDVDANLPIPGHWAP